MLMRQVIKLRKVISEILIFRTDLQPLFPSCFVLTSLACWSSVWLVSDGTVCLAAPVAALHGPLVECPLLSPAWTIFIAPVVL